jgi:hypothetical protein
MEEVKKHLKKLEMSNIKLIEENKKLTQMNETLVFKNEALEELIELMTQKLNTYEKNESEQEESDED